jgi:hypothetical protein
MGFTIRFLAAGTDLSVWRRSLRIHDSGTPARGEREVLPHTLARQYPRNHRPVAIFSYASGAYDPGIGHLCVPKNTNVHLLTTFIAWRDYDIEHVRRKPGLAGLLE